jgi:hypothetical protein
MREAPRLHFTRAGLATIGAALRFFSGKRGPGCSVFAEQTRHLAVSVASALLNGGNVQRRSGILDAAEFLRDHCEKLFETRVLGRIGR